jgi:hypothetical protein
MRKRILAGGLVLLVVLLVVGPMTWAAPFFQVRPPVISYPTDGATVSGAVEVRGVATHPNIDFYQVRYAPGAGPTADTQWTDFAIVEGQQVENDVLGTWDTTQLPDGQYTLALAVWGVNDANNPYTDFVLNLTVNNTNPPATPTPVQTPTEMPPPVTPTLGPTPTAVAVEQPPTPTPRPTPTSQPSAEGTPTASPGDGLDVALNVGQIREGFCTGGLITALLLSLWGGYVLAKAGVRWFLRRRSTSSSDMSR